VAHAPTCTAQSAAALASHSTLISSAGSCAYNSIIATFYFEDTMLNKLMIALVTLLATTLVHAHGTHAGNIHVEQAQARASVGNQSNGAAFLTIENQGKVDDVLQSVAAPIAGKVEIHTMTMEGDVMKMRTVERIELKAGETIEMKSGQGYHIMLIGLKKPLKAGDSFPMQLSFRKAGKVRLTVTVVEAGAASKSGQDEQMHEHHHHQ